MKTANVTAKYCANYNDHPQSTITTQNLDVDASNYGWHDMTWMQHKHEVMSFCLQVTTITFLSKMLIIVGIAADTTENVTLL